jgi:hypothetical protein
MSDLRKAAEQALEALDSDHPDIQLRAAITLRAALAIPEHKVNQELLDVLNRIDEICAAPPNFSDATIQEIVRATIAKFEQEQTMAKLQREAQERGEYEARLYVREAQLESKPLTDEEMRLCFTSMNTSEPLSEGWPGLERFARTIEKAHGIL